MDTAPAALGSPHVLRLAPITAPVADLTIAAMAAAHDPLGKQLLSLLTSAETALAKANSQVYLAQVQAGLLRAVVHAAASLRPCRSSTGAFFSRP